MGCHGPLFLCLRVSSIRALLGAYASGINSDWHRFAFFNDIHYVRNLVETNEDFELLVRLFAPTPLGGRVFRKICVRGGIRAVCKGTRMYP